MFDKDGNDTVDINEFGHLFNYVNAWIGTFQKFDTNKSSSIDSRELQQGEGKMTRNLFSTTLFVIYLAFCCFSCLYLF